MEQVNKRVTFKDIAIGTRKFRLNKIDAMTGSYILFRIVGLLAPAFEDILNDTIKEDKSLKDINKNKTDEDISGKDIIKIFTEITKLSKDDFQYVQKECLKVVHEIFTDDSQPSPPVLDEYGTIGIVDVDTPLIMNLTVQSLVFNLSGFFDVSLLNSKLEGWITSLQSSLT